jgi:hypothetical protein
MDRKQIVILAIVVTLLVALCVVAAFLALGNREFTPPPFDEAAEAGTPTVTDPDGRYGTATVEEGYSVGLCATPLYKDGALSLYFTCPSTNRAWMLVKIYDEKGRLLGQSGLVRPGEYLSEVALSRAPTGEKLTVHVLAYEPDTYYSLGTAKLEIGYR